MTTVKPEVCSQINDFVFECILNAISIVVDRNCVKEHLNVYIQKFCRWDAKINALSNDCVIPLCNGNKRYHTFGWNMHVKRVQVDRAPDFNEKTNNFFLEQLEIRCKCKKNTMRFIHNMHSFVTIQLIPKYLFNKISMNFT